MKNQRTKEQRHAEYLRTKDKCLARAKKWSEINPDKRKDILKRWNAKAIQYKRDWAQNKDFGTLIKLKECFLCSADRKLIVHHKDGNNGKLGKRLNNDLGNLVVLCRSCHARVHNHGEIRVLI